MEKVVLTCDCHDDKDHAIHVAFDDDAEYSCFYVSAALNHYLPWYKRLKLAVKYVLGIDNTYVHYVETVVSPKAMKELCAFVDKCKLTSD